MTIAGKDETITELPARRRATKRGGVSLKGGIDPFFEACDAEMIAEAT
jgi:hypothetical protein